MMRLRVLNPGSLVSVRRPEPIWHYEKMRGVSSEAMQGIRSYCVSYSLSSTTDIRRSRLQCFRYFRYLLLELLSTRCRKIDEFLCISYVFYLLRIDYNFKFAYIISRTLKLWQRLRWFTFSAFVRLCAIQWCDSVPSVQPQCPMHFEIKLYLYFVSKSDIIFTLYIRG